MLLDKMFLKDNDTNENFYCKILHKNTQCSEFLFVIGMLASRFMKKCPTISTETQLHEAKLSCRQ